MASEPAANGRRTGLLVDWGGVLTTNLFASFGAFCDEAGLAPDALVQAFRGNQEFRDTLIFPNVLQGQVRGNIGTGRANLGRLGKGVKKPGQNAPGDNSLALAIGALRDSSGTAALRTSMGAATFAAQVGLTGSGTLGDSFRDTVTSVGMQVNAATDSATVHDTLASQADTRRASVSGVSVDEELTLLMRYQQAFQAASRLVRTADEMMQSLLEMAT